MLETLTYIFSFFWNLSATVLFAAYTKRVILPNAVGLHLASYNGCADFVDDAIRMLAPPYLGYAFLSLVGLVSTSTDVKIAISTVLSVVFLANVLLECHWISTRRWKKGNIVFFMLFDFLVCALNAYLVCNRYYESVVYLN